MNYIQECGVCKSKWRYSFDEDITKEDLEDKLNIIRASCLPCGHQGMFTLVKEEEIKDDK